jgi:hypothetical protein
MAVEKRLRMAVRHDDESSHRWVEFGDEALNLLGKRFCSGHGIDDISNSARTFRH